MCIKKIFGNMNRLLLPLQQFFQQLLIKKGRGLWPAEALATPYSSLSCNEGATSIPPLAGQISQSKALNTFLNIFKLI
jgi:hypothetical protein